MPRGIKGSGPKKPEKKKRRRRRTPEEMAAARAAGEPVRGSRSKRGPRTMVGSVTEDSLEQDFVRQVLNIGLGRAERLMGRIREIVTTL